MNVYGSSEEHQPVTWVKGYPLYAAHLIVGVFVLTMIATAIIGGGSPVLGYLHFYSEAVLRGEVWRVLTYGLVNHPSLWFAVDMLMIVWFGRELEKFFGRRTFLFFFASIYLLSPALMLLIGLQQPTMLSGQRGAFALFIGFATLYPNAVMLFSLLAKWVALILVGIYCLMFISARDLMGLLNLLATAGFAFVFVRFQQGIITLPKFSLRHRKPKLRVLPDLPAKKAPGARPDESMAEVDALLDKIAKSGIGSLTPKERARLDAARENMLKRTSGRR